MSTIGERIETIRNSEKYSIEEFLAVLEVTRTSYYGWKNGKFSPGSDIVVRILNKFSNYRSEWLLLGSGEMKKPAYEIAEESMVKYGEPGVTKKQLQTVFKKLIDELEKL